MFSHRKALVLVLVFWLLGVSAILAGIFVRRAEARSAEVSREEEIHDMVREMLDKNAEYLGYFKSLKI